MKILLVIWLLTNGHVERHETGIVNLSLCNAIALAIVDRVMSVGCLQVWES